MSDTTPVLVATANTGIVSVCLLEWAGEGRAAIPSWATFFELGTVKKRMVRKVIDGHTYFRQQWTWTCEGYAGTGETKEAAIKAMLADCGYTEVTIDHTIEPLF